MENLTLIIPAKHEKDSLPVVLNELKNYELNIIVILEKTDVETIDSIKNQNCKMIFQNNKGYGDALIQGLQNVKTDYFCIFNADGSFDPKELNQMYKKANDEGYDLVFGSRYEKNSGSEDDTIITFVGNKIFSFIGKYFFSLPITDILYTYVLGSTKKLQEINFLEKEFSFCVELPIKSQRSNLSLISTPSYERRRFAGKKKVNAFKDGAKILISMIKLFFK